MDQTTTIKLLKLDRMSLITSIEHYIRELDALFKSPPSLDRGKRQAKLINDLETTKNIIKRINYGEDD